MLNYHSCNFLAILRGCFCLWLRRFEVFCAFNFAWAGNIVLRSSTALILTPTTAPRDSGPSVKLDGEVLVVRFIWVSWLIASACTYGTQLVSCLNLLNLRPLSKNVRQIVHRRYTNWEAIKVPIIDSHVIELLLAFVSWLRHVVYQ